MIPDRNIWYQHKTDQLMPGRLVNAVVNSAGELTGTLIIESHHWGDTWRLDDKPYGKCVNESWWFHNPSEELAAVLENAGFELPEDNLEPDWANVRSFTVEDIEEILEAGSTDDNTLAPAGAGSAANGGETTSVDSGADIPRSAVDKHHLKKAKAG
jgi:ribosomal protein L12E/L44/L45/RPP1/RPP2